MNMTNTFREDSVTPEEEFNGFTESNSPETLHANTETTNEAPPAPNVTEALAALLESNRLMQTTCHGSELRHTHIFRSSPFSVLSYQLRFSLDPCAFVPPLHSVSLCLPRFVSYVLRNSFL